MVANKAPTQTPHAFPFQCLDLTHTLHPDIPSWNGSCGFKHEVKLDYNDCDTDVRFRVGQIKMHAGVGTHLDAPRHCILGGRDVSQLSITELLWPCVMMDVARHQDARYTLTCAAVLAFEQTYGTIPCGSCVLVRTGWGERFWHQPKAYRNHGVFPSVSSQAADLLLSRGVQALGIDTLSPDCPESGFPVHQAFLGSNHVLIENVAHLKHLPPIGSFVWALPIKAQDATESPIRLVALMHKHSTA